MASTLDRRRTAAAHYIPIANRAGNFRRWFVWWVDYNLGAAFNDFNLWNRRFDQVGSTTCTEMSYGVISSAEGIIDFRLARSSPY